MVDILQMLSMTKRSGTLLLKRNQREGYIYIRNGRVMDAGFERWRGVSAVNKLLTWKEGSFEFHDGADNPDETISIGTNNLLLEGLRRLDEWGNIEEGVKSGRVNFVVPSQVKDLPIQGILNEEEKKFLDLTHQHRNLVEIVQKGSFPEGRALEIASELYLVGILDTEESLDIVVEIPTLRKKEGFSRSELQEIIDYLKGL